MGRAIGGSRTTGLLSSPAWKPYLGKLPVVGEWMPLCEAPARDDLRLIATLGEYVLPPKILVLRLPAKLPLPRPLTKACWFGRIALGMNMKERSLLGKTYRAIWSGRDTRTGLSRRKGGRCCGRRVCSFLGTLGTATRFAMPGKLIVTDTLPSSTEVENERFGGI